MEDIENRHVLSISINFFLTMLDETLEIDLLIKTVG
jgi:hypothetical protein